jgi:ABC-2 type transport system ATP-binding protein
LGGNVLEVRVTDRAELQRAASLIANLGSGPARLDAELNRILLPVKDGTRVLIAAGRSLEDNGIKLDDLGIRRPSLDDVFMAITGHPTRSKAELDVAMPEGVDD